MKKFTLFAGLALLGLSSANAEEVLNNPTLADGSYVVKYDIENHKFAESNDFEVDETFVFAVDITGTSYVEALQTTGRNPEILGRGIARDIYANNDVNAFPNFSNGANLDGRLFHIEGNIYGMTFNLLQYAAGHYIDGPFGYVEGGTYDCCQPGTTMTFGCNTFPFGWSATSCGAEWWNAIAEPISSLWFTTAPYTGTKTSPEFYFDDFTEEGELAFPGCEDSKYADKGYAKPEFYLAAIGGAGVGEVDAAAEGEPEWFNLQGVKVANPEKGIYICRRGAKVEKVVVK